MAKWKRDLIKTREKTADKFYQDLDISNKIWHGIINLTITLASSGLVLAVALTGQFPPPENGISQIPISLIVAWGCLFYQ